jgi:hypothetical protein
MGVAATQDEESMTDTNQTPQATKLFSIRIRNLSVSIWQNPGRHPDSIRYSVEPGRRSKQGDNTWNETADRLSFDMLQATAADLLRRANTLPIADAEDERRADHLRIMADLLREAHRWIADRLQADAYPATAAATAAPAKPE